MSDLMLHEKERRLLTCYIFLTRTRRNIQILLVSKFISKFHEEKVPKSSYKELRSRKYDKGGKSSSLLQA